MRQPKAYLETTFFNFCFAEDAAEKWRDTLALLEEIQAGKYKPYTSAYVVQELRRASEPQKGQMMGLIKKNRITVLPTGPEAERLADIYIAEGMISQKHITDALHIAVATVHDLDFIVSLNFKHIVKRKTMTMTEGINLREGYKRIGIFSPAEVIE